MKQTKVINFFAGPNAGKSTCAAELFGYMKRKEINCEYTGEAAKDHAWEKDYFSLDDQLKVFADQARRQYRLLGEADYIITDSPLMLTTVYLQDACKKYKEKDEVLYSKFVGNLYGLAKNTFDLYDNINFFVRRGDRKFQQEGRKHSYEECLVLDQKIQHMLDINDIEYQEIDDINPVIKKLGI